MKINLEDMSHEIVATLEYYPTSVSSNPSSPDYRDRSSYGIGIVDSKIYYLNQWQAHSSCISTRLYCYDTETNEESVVYNLGERLSGVTLGSLNRTLYLFGGKAYSHTNPRLTYTTSVRTTVKAYHVDDKRYYDTGIKYARELPSTPIFIDGKAYVFGCAGRNYYGDPANHSTGNEIYVIDLINNLSYLSNVTLPHSLHTTRVSSIGHKAYIFSGRKDYNSTADPHNFKIYVYDTTDDTVKVYDQEEYDKYESAVLNIDGTIYLLGGVQQDLLSQVTDSIYTIEMKDKITGEITENSTDNEIPTAKAIYDYVAEQIALLKAELQGT
jgi:N-acetylneuraminic acid mutarotase